MNEDGGPADAGDGVLELSPADVEVGVEADEEHDILYGLEAGKSETTRLKSRQSSKPAKKKGSARTSIAARQDSPRC